tara:strand:- start:294 stop:1076 length:783 start_codon:yes stop_codon:yes gene_type:complete
MNNIVFLTAVDIPSMKEKRKDYNPSCFQYGIDSFKNWAVGKNVDVVVLDELLYPHEDMKVNFQRYYAFDILKNSGIDYDQILISDVDCIIHPECPNFFEMTDNNYTVVRAVGSVDWILRSYENYSKHLFGDKKFPYYNYFNAGFQIVNKKHEYIFKQLIDLYWGNKDLVIKMMDTFGVGTDQPIINFLANLSGEDMKFLPYEFCMTDMTRLEVLSQDMMFADNFPGIYQFNSLPSKDGKALMGDVSFWMQRTFEHLYNKK